MLKKTMKLKTFFCIILISTLIYSCKKEDEIIEPNPANITATSYPNFAQLKVGNYWVYEQFDVDSNGTSVSKNLFDSCYVEKDTIINSNLYFKIVKPKPYFATQKDISFQRDSLHYVVNSNGKILFSSQDFSTVFDSQYYMASPGDTLCQMIKKMTDKDIPVSTPAGSYLTSNAKETYYMFPSWSTAGNPRYKHTRYTENIGITIETLPLFASNPNSIERRLIRYHLN